MSKPKPSDAFHLNKSLLYYNAMWPMSGSRLLYRIFTVFMMSTIFVAYIALEAVQVLQVSDDLMQLVDITLILLTHLVMAPKILNFCYYFDRVKKLSETFDDPLFEGTEHTSPILRAAEGICRRDAKLFLGMSLGTVTMWSLEPIISGGISRGIMPRPCWFPLDVLDLTNYWICYVYQIVCLVYAIFVNVPMDTTASGLMVLAKGQLQALAEELRRMGQEEGKWKEDVKKCVIKHNAIIIFVKELEIIFSISIMSQFAAGCLIICITAFCITLISPLSMQCFSLVLYQSCMLVQILLYCWHGNEIILQSDALSQATFECSWSQAPADFKSSLLMLQEKNKRPLKVAAGKIFDLSISTFMWILKSSYSVFAVLQQINSK